MNRRHCLTTMAALAVPGVTFSQGQVLKLMVGFPPGVQGILSRG